jgi:hypothetical protein
VIPSYKVSWTAEATGEFAEKYPFRVAFFDILCRRATTEEIGRALRWADHSGYDAEWNNTFMFFTEAEHGVMFKLGFWVDYPP